MKTITIHPTVPMVTVTAKEYRQMRDKLIDDIMLNVNKVYKKDKEMFNGIKNLCDELRDASFDKTSVEFVRGMSGFIYWASLNSKKVSAGAALTTLVHDLGEFARNRTEAWFSPRTSMYWKFLG